MVLFSTKLEKIRVVDRNELFIFENLLPQIKDKQINSILKGNDIEGFQT